MLGVTWHQLQEMPDVLIAGVISIIDDAVFVIANRGEWYFVFHPNWELYAKDTIDNFQLWMMTNKTQFKVNQEDHRIKITKKALRILADNSNKKII